jgi:CRP/FNR family transcriptional regulator, anaerobic regulatory protein
MSELSRKLFIEKTYPCMLPSQIKQFDEMIDFLKSVYQVPDDLKEAIWKKTHLLKVGKRKHILKAGEVCHDLYFIRKGLLRCYYYTRKGKEVSTWFMWENDVCVSIPSFYRQVPGYEYIQAIEDCELICIRYEDLYELFRNYPGFNFIGRELLQKYLLDWALQLQDIRLLRTQERYESLRERQPDHIRRIPQKYLASFLDMLPTSLSRIRRQRKKKGGPRKKKD